MSEEPRPDQVERTFVLRPDGSKELVDERVYPGDREPGVVYDKHGVPDPYATALQRRRWRLEREEEYRDYQAKLNAERIKQRTAERDRAIGEFALRAALADERADNTKWLPSYVQRHWKAEWRADEEGEPQPLAVPTIRRILKEQHVASHLKDHLRRPSS